MFDMPMWLRCAAVVAIALVAWVLVWILILREIRRGP